MITCHVRVIGEENIPRQGPVILASNHVSLLDPIVIGCVVKRPIDFMAKQELFRNPIFATILKWVYAFPVRRGEADRQAFRHSLRILERGRVLGVFPEGTRSVNGKLLPAMSGTALIASKSGAPVIPIAVLGTREIWKKNALLPCPGRIEVRIGKPLVFSRDDEMPIGVMSEKIMNEIAALMADTGGEAIEGRSCR
ncbi:MAG: 1-acyl-sn-glycerol-3-phosphate acyltransferase [Firmicutes bacterium]|nr:1-acyl-sn-glycerol-3-phosphate acyltransferase [Bacillota bacterium]